MAQLAHRASLDLTDAFACEVERLADFFERARFAAVETEAKREDLAFALVERCEQTGDLFRQQCGCCDFERRLCRTVLDDVAEFGIAVLAQRLGQRQRFGGEAQCFGQIGRSHV